MENIFFNINKCLEDYNENLNENIFFDKIKNYIQEFISKNAEKLDNKLPLLLKFIKNLSLNFKYKTQLFIFIAISLSNFGFSNTKTKEIFDNNNITIDWNKFNYDPIDLSNLKFNFKLGDYTISEDTINYFYNNIKAQLPYGCKKISGTIVVTISDDINRNFANDDTDADKKSGGKLLDKRISSAYRLIENLQKKFNLDSIKLNFNVISDITTEHELYIKRIKVFGNYIKKIANISDGDPDLDDNNISPTINPSTTKDISNLSRNYQFVELLKLGNINTERFNRDNVKDDYSVWIIDTRKHIKSFLTRLKEKFPEYNLNFNVKAKGITPVTGSVTGSSNIRNQYQRIKSYESLNTGENIYDKWNYILGSKFPNLTEEQAINFENNIKTLLLYLEQMYGSSALELDYNK
jgi:hypothetical protein